MDKFIAGCLTAFMLLTFLFLWASSNGRYYEKRTENCNELRLYHPEVKTTFCFDKSPLVNSEGK